LKFRAEDWDRVIETNLNSCFFLSQIAARSMMTRKHGKIINIASEYSRFGAQSGIPYVTVDPTTPEPIGDQKIAEFLRLSAKPSHASAWFEENFNAKTQARTLSGLLNGLLPLLKKPVGSKIAIAAEESLKRDV
jgi:hypothetical protein